MVFQRYLQYGGIWTKLSIFND
eukprot:UN10990